MPHTGVGWSLLLSSPRRWVRCFLQTSVRHEMFSEANKWWQVKKEPEPGEEGVEKTVSRGKA